MKKADEFFGVFFVVACLLFGSCCDDGTTDITGSNDVNINWTSQTNGTLTVTNNTNNDVVLFTGQVPNTNTILGGVRAFSVKDINISGVVNDFETGGYMLLRGMTLAEYTANKDNLSSAKVEYTGIATYGIGKKFRVEISPAYFGNYGFKVNNTGRIGIELRKDSPDGERIAYIPALAMNYTVYTNSADNIYIYPVYVFWNKVSQTITTIKPTSFSDAVNVAPKLVAGGIVPSYNIPNDPTTTWESIVSSITYPVAYIAVTNNLPSQACWLTLGQSNLIAQNGYNVISPGERTTFELASTNEGSAKSLNMVFFGGTVVVPVLLGGSTPVIKNGYQYTLTISYTGTEIGNPESYTASIVEGEKLDVSDLIMSL